MSVVFGDALILAVSSCPKWPRQRDLKNVPGQAKDLKKLFHDLGFCTWHPDQENLTQQGVKDAVADLCQHTERTLQEISEEHFLVTVAVLSHGRKRVGSALPDMVCYDSFGEHIDSNDADLDEVLLNGFRNIQVPEGKRLKVWLLLDCCQSNEEISQWRAPEKKRMTKLERRCFGHPSHVDFLFFLPCDPGKEAHDYFSISKAITEVLTCSVQPITLLDACRSAMVKVQNWSLCTIRPRIVERGDFGSILLLEKLSGQGRLARVYRFLQIHKFRFLTVLIFLLLLCICCYGFYIVYLFLSELFGDMCLRARAILHAFTRLGDYMWYAFTRLGDYMWYAFTRLGDYMWYAVGLVLLLLCLLLCCRCCLAEVERDIQKMVSECSSRSGIMASYLSKLRFDKPERDRIPEKEERLHRALEWQQWCCWVSRVLKAVLVMIPMFLVGGPLVTVIVPLG